MARHRHLPLALLLAGSLPAQESGERLRALVRQEAATADNDATATLQVTEQALGLARQGIPEADHKTFARLVSNLVRKLLTQAHQGRGSEAAALLHEAYRLADEAGVLTRPAHFRRRAECAQLVDDLEAMSTAIQRGIRSQGLDRFEATLLLTLATRLQTQLGRADQARLMLESALINAEQLQQLKRANPKKRRQIDAALTNTVMAAADLYLMCGDYDNAIAIIAGRPIGEARIELGNHLTHPSCEIYSLLARMLRSRDDDAIAAANELHQRCVRGEIGGYFLAVIAPKLVRKAILDGDLDLARQRFDAMTEAIAGLPDADRIRQRLATQEMELATRGLLEVTEPLVARADAAFDGLLASWRRSPLLPDGVGLLHVDDRATLFANYLRFVVHLDAGASGKQRAFEHLARAHAASRHATETPSVEQVRASLLGDGHGLLVLAPGRGTSVMLLLDAAGLEVFELPDTVRLRPAVERLVDAACELVDAPEGNPRRWQKRAARLRDMLLPEGARKRIAGWRRLSVCGAGMLHNAPFELLPIEAEGEQRYLGEHLAIDYFANLSGAMARPARRNAKTVLMAASLQTRAGGREPARVDRDRLRPALRNYPNQRELFDQDVRTSRIAELLPTASVVHFIGHGMQDERRRFQNGIRFGDGDDESLWGGELLDLDLDLDGLVAIVGSCQLGAAPYRRGGEPMAASLGGALLQAKARCVIVPLSNLRVGNHMAAMQVVHERLARGDAPANALHAARAQLEPDANAAAWLELMLMQVHGRGF